MISCLVLYQPQGHGIPCPMHYHAKPRSKPRAPLHRNVQGHPHHPRQTKKETCSPQQVTRQLFLSLVAPHSQCRLDPRNHRRYQVSHSLLPIAKCQPLKTCKDLSIIVFIVFLHVQSLLLSLSLYTC